MTWLARLADRWQVTPTVLLLSAAVALFALVEVVIVAVLLTRSFTAPPPLRYTQTIYAPEASALCPGDALRWRPRLTVDQPGHLELSRTFWDRTRNAHALLADGTPSAEIRLGRNFPLDSAGQVRENAAQVVVPDLAPGVYILINVVSRPGAGWAQYEVPFTVRGDCDARNT